MATEQPQVVSGPEVRRDTLVVSQIRFLRESLVEILAPVAGMRVCGEAATLDQALASAERLRPAVVLLDAGFPGGTAAAARIGATAPQAHLIVLGLAETEANVIAWAEAGIAGYVPDTASVNDLIALIEQITCGEQVCSSRVAGGLLRRIAAGRRAAPPAPPALTRREREIFDLVGAGLSNKDIARRLAISLGTTKSHVHNLLAKLSVQRRADVMAEVSGALKKLSLPMPPHDHRPMARAGGDL